jgi:hypothetical protein
MVFQPAFANDNSISFNKVEQQSRGKTFKKTYGGIDYDKGKYVQQTSDGGYIITGGTMSFGAGDYDVWLIKTDSNGNKEWDKTFGGTNEDVGYCVQQTTDNGYIIIGIKDDYIGGSGHIWLIKTNSTGDMVWDKTFGGSGYNEGRCVQQTTNGGYIITGGTSGNVRLIKTNSTGDMIWDKTFGSSTGNFVRQTIDGGYIIITGERYSLIKTDSDGNKVWERTFGETSWDKGKCVQQTNDGGYIIVGESAAHGQSDVWLIKTDKYGNNSWEKTFFGGGLSYGNYVQQTTDGGYIIAGYSYVLINDDLWLIKTDSNGTMVWDRTYGGDGRGYCVHQTTDGGYSITGETWSFGAGMNDVWLIKTDKDGNVKSKSVPGNVVLLRILERFPMLWRLVSRLNIR